MKRVLRWLGIGVAFIIVSLLLLIAGGYYMMMQTVAPYSGSQQVAGLSSSVSIIRDQNALPHIIAKNRLDAVRALGWVHASERLWQMEVLRMAAQGRLSELFGEKAISSDRFLKTIDLADAAKRAVSSLRPDSIKILESYRDGVNAWINRQKSTFEPALPVEFIVLGAKPEPWQTWHSLAIIKVMALTLDANMNEEIGRLTLASKGFSPELIDEVYLAGPRDIPPLLPDLRKLYGFGANGKSFAELDKSSEPALATAPWQLQLPASNNWAISGSKTESGKPLLANDPHLAFTAPSTFFLAHLQWQNDGSIGNLIGGTIPGTPAVLSGRNDKVAWGLTTTYLDSQDLFLEKLNPQNPDQYLGLDGYEDFKKREIVIKVKGGEDVAFTRFESRHGPVLPDGYKRLSKRLPNGHVAALSWTALLDGDHTMDGVLDIGIAENVDDFIGKTKNILSPMQSIVVADVEGNIAVVAPGKVPKRSFFNKVAGRAPVPGWLAQYDWEGFLKADEVPISVNPISGAVATANANWLPADYKNHIAYDWAEHFRQARVEELFVTSNQQQSVKTMIAGQLDTRSQAMIDFRDMTMNLLPQGVRINEEILNAITNWDGKMERDQPLPLIMTAWHKTLQEMMLSDDLGDDFDLIKKGRITRILSMLEGRGVRNWCDDIRTDSGEDCSDVVYRSLQAAIKELESAYGKDWKQWRWGTAHKTRHEHRPFSRVGLLAPYFTIEREMSGGTYTLLRNSNNFAKKLPYAGMHGSAIRTIYDFDDLEKSMVIQASGESGNVFSPHYDDLSTKWANLEYIPMITKLETIEKSALGTFKLMPQ